MDTIFALASAQGKSGVAVIRVSGPKAPVCLTLLCGEVPARQASLRTLSFRGEILDQALVMSFPAPNSFTGEDVVEFHVHGSAAIIQALSRALSGVEDVRLAEPGEFSRRAFENEKMDLTQVEALGDLIEAETEAQRQQAMRVLSGELGRRAQEWRNELIRAVALLTVTIDFVDEEVPTDVGDDVLNLLTSVAAELVRESEKTEVAERVRTGFEVAIIGPPNAGKSTLLNALAGRDAAITSEVAGTTRDVIEVRVDLQGIPVTILDTAGLRVTQDVLEAAGVERAKKRADQADLRVILCEPGMKPVMDARNEDLIRTPKSDLGNGDFSAVTGEGLNALVSDITEVLSNRVALGSIGIRERHRVAMMNANASLRHALDRLRFSPDMVELIVEDVQQAIFSLESLIGFIGVEDILDDVFRNFCIGK